MENTTDMRRLDFDIDNDEQNTIAINVLASSFTMFKIGKYQVRARTRSHCTIFSDCDCDLFLLVMLVA